MKAIVILVSIFLYIPYSFAITQTESQRRCLLLPVNDEVGGAIGFGVFEEIERYLKESEWCYYNSNAEILNILSSYKRNLNNHLNTPEVLKVLSDKTKSGSMIKIEIKNEVRGAQVSLSIIGSNGEDVYFKEKSTVENNEIEVIAQVIKNWLDLYDKQIPFDGIVTGLLGNQFTVDMGQASGVYANNEIIIVRPIRKKRHPLLKEVVEYETEKLATGKLFHVSRIQSQGEIKSFEKRKKIRLGDWVLLNKKTKTIVKDSYDLKKKNSHKFGRLGTISILLGIGSGSDTLAGESSTTELSGLNFGASINAEIWATRNYFFGLNIGKKFSSTSITTGTADNAPTAITYNDLDLLVGYRYLPMGFFYGPRVNLLFGYGSYGYDMNAGGGFTESIFSGIMMGVRGSMPLEKKIRLFLQLDFIISPSYEEEVVINGIPDSASSYRFSIGGKYSYATRMTLDASFDIRTSKAKFKSPTRSVSLKDTAINVGATFTF